MITFPHCAFSHKDRQNRNALHCHNGLVYISKIKVNLIFPKVSCKIKAKTIIMIIME